MESEGGKIEPGGRNRKLSVATDGPLGQGWRGRNKGQGARSWPCTETPQKLAASFPGKAHSFSAKGGRDVWP